MRASEPGHGGVGRGGRTLSAVDGGPGQHKPGEAARTLSVVDGGPGQHKPGEAALTTLLARSAVDELLLGGADPNLVLPDGAAALHLAAGARRPRGLRCLGLLLLRGGDPNVR